MTEDKKDSFWDSKNDDFWSKPVISEDWLKSDTDSFWKNHITEENISVSNAADQNAQVNVQNKDNAGWQSHRDVKGLDENPYIQHYTPEQVQDILEGKKPRKVKNCPYETPAKSKNKIEKRTKPVKKNESDKVAKVGKKHIHTKICLCAIGFTVLIVCACVAAAKWQTKVAVQEASVFHGVEEKAGNRIRLTDNSTMILEDTVYTVVKDVDDKFFHEKVKIVGVYAELDCVSDSSDYDVFKNSTLNPYIGYDTERGKEYRTVCNSWDAEEYGLENVGFSEEYFVYSYVNKGYDSVGYYFFTVPMDVEEIDFYVETYSYKKGARLVESIYSKNMNVEENPDLEELLSRKVVR